MKTIPLVFLSVALAAVPALARPANPDLQPIGITHSLDHAFPEALARMHPNGGEARILVTVRADGELAEWLVTSYTALDFKAEAIAALKEMKFSAARYKGEKITARSEITLSFETKGMLVSTATSMENFEVATRNLPPLGAYQPIAVEKLDRIPKVLHAVSPSYPQELAKRGFAGDVVVDFFIDENGEVKMPSVLDFDTSPLGEAAVRAIRQWQFEPPIYRGKPALAHVQQVFKFDPNSKSGG